MAADSLRKHPARITLRDVINHMSHMEERLSERLDRVEKTLSVHSKKFIDIETRLSQHMDDLEYRLTKRIDALDEDLTATIKDTILIHSFVGMPLPEEE